MQSEEPEALFQSDPGEPLGFAIQQVQAADYLPDIRLASFQFSSRGDRVPGRLRFPASGDAPFPLVILEHGAGGAKDSEYLDAVAAPWVRAGAAVASIDLPLHGERRSAKMSDRLLGALGEPASQDALGVALLVDFARQAVVDLRRCLDALLPLEEVNSQRVVFAGFSLGAMVGVNFCAFDHRPKAAALALAGGGTGPAAVDPIGFIDRCRNTDLLLVGANGDETVPRSATQALFDAAPEPKELLWFDGSHGQLPGIALKAMWEFLRERLI